MPTQILHPERLDLTGPGGTLCHGADQDWFPDPWQRRAGCGPTTASLIFHYLARQRSEFSPLRPEMGTEWTDFLEHMCRVWEYVTPRSHGLNRPEYMVEGMADSGFFHWLCMSIARLVHYRTVPIFIAFMLMSAITYPSSTRPPDWWTCRTILSRYPSSGSGAAKGATTPGAGSIPAPASRSASWADLSSASSPYSACR